MFELSGIEALFVVERQPPAWRFLTWYGVFARRHGRGDRLLVETPDGASRGSSSARSRSGWVCATCRCAAKFAAAKRGNDIRSREHASARPRRCILLRAVRAGPKMEAPGPAPRTGFEVFLLRRHKKASFMASAFVFPGGATEER